MKDTILERGTEEAFKAEDEEEKGVYLHRNLILFHHSVPQLFIS